MAPSVEGILSICSNGYALLNICTIEQDGDVLIYGKTLKIFSAESWNMRAFYGMVKSVS